MNYSYKITADSLFTSRKGVSMENSMDQNLSLYHIFNTVAEAGNISHAARALYKSARNKQGRNQA